MIDVVTNNWCGKNISASPLHRQLHYVDAGQDGSMLPRQHTAAHGKLPLLELESEMGTALLKDIGTGRGRTLSTDESYCCWALEM